MKWLTTVPITAALLLMIACNPDRVYESHNTDFPDRRWLKDNDISFSVLIEDTISEYKVYLALRHVYGFQFEVMNVQVVVTPPSGKSVTKDYELQIMGGNDVYLSDCSGDICDREVLIEDHVRFLEAGNWSYVVKNNMNIEYVPNVMEFGLIIDKYAGKD